MTVPVDRIVILGAGGDLTGRYLLPALATLYERGQLPRPLTVIGAGRHDWSDERFRRHAGEQLDRYGAGVPAGFGDRLRWRRADAGDPADLRGLLGGDGDDGKGPAVFYLALPPAVYPAAVDALVALRPPAGSRLVVEKPFGTGLASAQDLNRRIGQTFGEQAVFRVDHFLAKQTVQNVLGLRFANRLFEAVWHRSHISHVEIVWDETLGLEGRAGYYDHTGALRDMLQNHLLQLLALVAMEPPAGLGERDLRDRKLDVLRATRAVGPDEADRPSVRARYTAGTVDGRRLPDYVDEPGVDPGRHTETFAQVDLLIDNWRWAGVPFRLRSGKALAADRTEIALHFRPVPHLPFNGGENCLPNLLRLAVDPDEISLRLNLNGAGDPMELEQAELDLQLAPQELPAYARLLLDIVEGDPTLSIRGDEAEQAWRIMEPILATWDDDQVPLESYRAGSTGPAGAGGGA
jgi:glucose-6-phosphate 1-dehydrogenase